MGEEWEQEREQEWEQEWEKSGSRVGEEWGWQALDLGIDVVKPSALGCAPLGLRSLRRIGLLAVGPAGFSWVRAESGLQRFYNSNNSSLLFMTDLVDKRWQVTIPKTLGCVFLTQRSQCSHPSLPGPADSSSSCSMSRRWNQCLDFNAGVIPHRNPLLSQLAGLNFILLKIYSPGRQEIPASPSIFAGIIAQRWLSC